MNQQTTQTLETLKDLEGILGSFVISSSGSIIAQDLPSYFGSAAYDIGPRAQRLQEALAMTEGEVAHCVLRYGSHKLALRPFKGAMMAILSESATNMPALRMAMNLVAKKLEKQGLYELVGSSAPIPPTVRPSGTPAPAAVDVAPPPAQAGSRGAPEASGARPSKNRAVYFRGKRIS